MFSTNSETACRTAIWFWMTSTGAGSYTPHNATVNDRGFGETIRSINGDVECDGKGPMQVSSRVDKYRKFVGVLGTSLGPGKLDC